MIPPISEIRRKPFDLARDDAEAGGVVPFAPIEDRLGAETDPEEVEMGWGDLTCRLASMGQTRKQKN